MERFHSRALRGFWERAMQQESAQRRSVLQTSANWLRRSESRLAVRCRPARYGADRRLPFLIRCGRMVLYHWLHAVALADSPQTPTRVPCASLDEDPLRRIAAGVDR